MGLGHDPARHARFAAEGSAALREDPRELYYAAHSAERISRYVTYRMLEMEPSRPAPTADRPPPAPEREPGRER